MQHCSVFCVKKETHSHTCVSHRSEGEGKSSPIKMQSTIIFNLVVLSQLANTCKAVIEVSREGKDLLRGCV